MKLNIAYPAHASQSVREMTSKEEQKLYGKKIGDCIDGSIISEEFSGCVLKITGGNDYQGVPMVPNHEVGKKIRLLLKKGDIGYRCKRVGVRKRKTVRGSIITNDIQAISLSLLSVPEEKEIKGLTDVVNERSHLPKRDDKLRELFGIPEDCKDIKKYVYEWLKKENPDGKLPKIAPTGHIHARKAKAIKDAQEKRRIIKEKNEKARKSYEELYGVKI